MMAHKALHFNDKEAFNDIRATLDPCRQKMIGRKVKNFDPVEWNKVAKVVVYRGTALKFDQNDDLMKILIKTRGTTLVEASPYDKIWGIGLGKTSPDAKDRSKWQGTNWLGEVLTEYRDGVLRHWPKDEALP